MAATLAAVVHPHGVGPGLPRALRSPRS